MNPARATQELFPSGQQPQYDPMSFSWVPPETADTLTLAGWWRRRRNRRRRRGASLPPAVPGVLAVSCCPAALVLCLVHHHTPATAVAFLRTSCCIAMPLALHQSFGVITIACAGAC